MATAYPSNLVYTNKTIGGRSSVVNLSNVLEFSESGSVFSGTPSSPSSQTRYGIIFTFIAQGQNPQKTEWKYDDENDRDYDMTWLLSENAKQVGYSD